MKDQSCHSNPNPNRNEPDDVTTRENESQDINSIPLHELVRSYTHLPKENEMSPAEQRFNAHAPLIEDQTIKLLVEKHGWVVKEALGDDTCLEKSGEQPVRVTGGILQHQGLYLMPADVHACLRGFETTQRFLESEGYSNEVLSKDKKPSENKSSEELDCILDRCRLTTETEIPVSRTIFTLGGVEVATNANLVDVVAQSKAGKTALLSGAVAAAISGDNHLGWEAENRRGAIIYIDTEQSLADCRRSVIDTAMRRCGMDTMPENLLVYNVKRERTEDMWSMVAHAMRRASKSHGSVYAVIIDGVADLVHSVNDEEESNEKVAALLNLASEFDTTIFTVLHANPGARLSQNDISKGRGHLGSQLERKCESMIALSKNETSQTTRITAPITRRKPLVGDEALHMQWDDTTTMFQLVEKDSSEEDEIRLKEVRKLETVWGPDLNREWTKTEIIKRLQDPLLMGELRVSEATARRLFRTWYPQDTMKLREGTEERAWLCEAPDDHVKLAEDVRETFEKIQRPEVAA
ncbi:AAA family ATPase [Cerasicoccus frondis]|uniref:AAA family ATPase n=1 Tax=Cerasicoccus frondis TaxID=490090 RepID=UPI00285258C0|nr:AAA family ATPase [Cerasicoccus frondis]